MSVVALTTNIPQRLDRLPWSRFHLLLVIALGITCFNAVFFTYGLVLTHFYHTPENRVGIYLLPLTLTNFAGPLLLGSLFDTLGRKKMITATFAISAVLLLLTAGLFGGGILSAWTQTAAWMTIFFFASTAASSAYLTASEPRLRHRRDIDADRSLDGNAIRRGCRAEIPREHRLTPLQRKLACGKSISIPAPHSLTPPRHTPEC